MNTKEYIQKYSLDKSNQFNHDEFVADFTNEFLALLEVGKGSQNIKGFENAARAIKMKWDAVSSKTLGTIPHKLWFYFKAEVVDKMRVELFPEEVAKQAADEKERRERAEQRRKREAEWDRKFASGFDFFSRAAFLLAIMRKAAKPIAEFATMELAPTATLDDVKKKYKELTLLHHPDRGGSHEKFIKITEAKNKLLAFLEN